MRLHPNVPPMLAAALRLAFPPADVPERNDIAVERRVAIPMRDGVTLNADVYRPVARRRYPVLVSRTPYDTRLEAASLAAAYFARRGYVYVYQDVRGRHQSDGRWEPFRDDERDGYDTIEWAARQPWSNGMVGMQGSSYLGQNQWRAAQAAPPNLVTIYPSLASASIYHDWVTLNGAWRLLFNVGWTAVRKDSRMMPRRVDRRATVFQEWLAHPDYNDYWQPLSAEETFATIAIPVHTFGGWFDIFVQGTLRGYVGISRQGATERVRRGSQMVIGPWGHGASRQTGDLDFGAAADVSELALQLRWYDYWLKGFANGLASEPPVKLFVMGRNEWVFENEYPLARTDYQPLYFASGGHANSDQGDGRLMWTRPDGPSTFDRFRYDPADPVPSVGGNYCCGTPSPEGPRDQRRIERRPDVLVYTSEPLDEELEVTGPLKVVLHASSDAPDTDFFAKLVDVHPNGASYNIAAGVVRARYRDSVAAPAPLVPGHVYRFEIDLVGTSIAFLKGHRIRVHLTSSDFPHFDRNPNTGATCAATNEGRVAEQTVFHDAQHPSHILLPVIPPRARSS